MVMLRGWLVSIMLLYYSALACGNETPTLSELESAYKQNVLAIAPFSVEWQEIRTEHEGAIEQDKLKSSLIDAVLSSSHLPKELESQVTINKQMLDTSKGELSPESVRRRLTPKTQRYYFWTDHKSFQLRWPPPKADIVASLDSAEVSPQSLVSNYSSIKILSWSPSSTPHLRLWMGVPNDSRLGAALVTSGGVETVSSNAHFPPMGAVHEEWGAIGLFNELDRIFSVSKNCHSEIVAANLNNVKAIQWRCFFASGAGSKMIKRLKIWFVPDRGFLPVKIEESFVSKSYPPEQADKYARIYRVVNVGGIKQYGTSFYPMLIEEQQFAIDAKWQMEHPGNIPDEGILPMALVKSIRTEVISLSPKRNLSVNSIALRFPSKSRYLNKNENHWYMEGVPKEEFDRQIRGV